MSYNVSRLTLYAILSSVEDDLRALIQYYLSHVSPNELFGDEVYKKALERLLKDVGGVGEQASFLQVLMYIDFGDLFLTLNSNREHLPKDVGAYFKSITLKLEKLVGIRNRVAHSRPLNYDDLSIVLDTSESLLKSDVVKWNGLRSTLIRLKEEPSFVLGISIPSYDVTESVVNHNLPIPDFDETGFLGRKRQSDDLIKLCLGPYPVVTIVGEGGIGKTALALKVAYDIIDLPDSPFDAVVWSSSKTTQLTHQEIINIQGAIGDSLGMFRHVAHQLGSNVDSPEYLDEVLDYLKEFKILLVLDNLETVLDERVREFLGKLPYGSKVLITSRIGVGAFEYPYKLTQMDETDAVQLLRASARIRGVEKLFSLPQFQLSIYCKKMNNNPGFIKWFVSAVQTGKRPEEVLSNTDVFLEFCMSNVYHFLSNDARKILTTMLCIPGPQSQAELVFLNDLDAFGLQRFLHELLRTNMVIMSSTPVGSSFESTYELSDLARQYLVKKHPADSKVYEKVTRKKRQIVAAAEQFKADQVKDPYSFYSLQMRSKSDLIVAKYLLDALKFSKKKDFERAEKLIIEAKGLAPEYFEVYRVEALVKLQGGNPTAAQSAYEIAIELEPLSAPLRKWYGSFLLRYRADCESALVQFKKANELDPTSAEINIEIARALLYLSRFTEALPKLKDVISKSDLALWSLRKAYDLYLQCFIRRAEDYLTQHDEISAIENLEEFNKAYNDCPPNLIDTIMTEKVKMASDIALACVKLSRNDDAKLKANTFVKIFTEEYSSAGNKHLLSKALSSLEEAGRVTGKIVSLKNGFGFIVLDENKEQIFFHRSDLISEYLNFSTLCVGDSVSCIISPDPKRSDGGVRATQIIVYS